MAEEEGFEPPGPLRAQRFSRPPVSTAHALLRFQFYQQEQFTGPICDTWEFPLLCFGAYATKTSHNSLPTRLRETTAN